MIEDYGPLIGDLKKIFNDHNQAIYDHFIESMTSRGVHPNTARAVVRDVRRWRGEDG